MLVIERIGELKSTLERWRSEGSVIHFVPTMGALHPGHISLVKEGLNDGAKMVVSVFVNPTQFNDPNDLQKYPRTFDEDRELLKKNGCDLMFYPSAEEIYANKDEPVFDLDGLDKGMDGKFRSGHFNGVVQVVDRFFSIINPDQAYFGEKDFQQLAIIKHMMAKLGHHTKVIGCPTVREANGLAMSSRNTLLSDNGKEKASILQQALIRAREAYIEGENLTQIVDQATSSIQETTGIELEYFEVVDPNTLIPILNNDGRPAVACLAAYLEEVRLIDNMRLNA